MEKSRIRREPKSLPLAAVHQTKFIGPIHPTNMISQVLISIFPSKLLPPPLSPLTNIQPSRSRLEIPLPPKHGVIMNTEFQAPLPTLDSSVLVQAEYTRREHVFKSPSIKKTQETNRRLNTNSPGHRDFRNIGSGYETGTMENSSHRRCRNTQVL